MCTIPTGPIEFEMKHIQQKERRRFVQFVISWKVEIYKTAYRQWG